MRISNIYNLPPSIVSAVTLQARKPTAGRISCTRLIDSPQIAKLTALHWEEIEIDASENLWSLLGNLGHAVLDQHAPTNSLSEENLAITFEDTILSGRPDLYVNSVIQDWKFTSVWSFLHGVKKEWEKQLNVYAFMYRYMTFPVEGLTIYAILRDWNKNESLTSKEYPPIPFIETPVALWGMEQQSKYISERLIVHKTVDTCNDDERWKRASRWAVMKAKNKRATRVFDTELDACNYMLQENLKIDRLLFSVVERPGAYVRCESYCNVSKFCPQWAKWVEDNPKTPKENENE